MFSHVHIGISDFDASFRFWSAVMAELELDLRFHDREAGWAGWKPVGADRPLFLIGRPYDGNTSAPGNGAMIAFLGSSREAVDRTHHAAIEAGGTSEGDPGLRPHYHPDYYGAYFRDPDGNKACICCHDAPSA